MRHDHWGAAQPPRAHPTPPSEARKREIPIIQLNPGGVLNWKYQAECEARASGFPYTIVRCTGAGAARGWRGLGRCAAAPRRARWAWRPWQRPSGCVRRRLAHASCRAAEVVGCPLAAPGTGRRTRADLFCGPIWL